MESDLLPRPQGTVIEIAILNHALKKGYIHPDYHKQLASWYQSGQLKDSAQLFSAICVNLHPEQVESLKTLFEILQIQSQISNPAEESVEAHAPVHAIDPRQQIIDKMGHLLREHPHFSPQADLFLEVHEKLGEGGMGAVYRVHDKRLERDAALKVIQDQVASPYAVERFLREIKITARLDHPAIPPVYDSGTNVKGQHFMLMRMIEGSEFSDMIRKAHERRIDYQRDKLKIAELLEVLVKVGEAVAYAHSEGIIHRDLKPENILVGPFGEVMVMDWGLAKHMDRPKDHKLDRVHKAGRIDELSTQESNLTQAGNLMGTLGYMSPEQAEDCTAVSEYTDVFALGAILTEILTGRPPIDGQTPIMRLTNTVNGVIHSPKDLHSGVPPEINAIAEKALRTSLARRTRSVSEFTSDLKSYLAGREVDAYQYTSFEQVIVYVKQNPAVILGTPLLILVSIFALSFWLKSSYLSHRLEDSKTELLESKELLSQSEAKALAATQALNRIDRQKVRRQAAPAQTKSASDWIVQAQESLEKGESLRRIAFAADKAIQIADRKSQVVKKVAKIFIRAGAEARAVKLLKDLAARDKNDCEALFLLHTLKANSEKRAFEFSPELQELAKRTGGVQNNPYWLFAKAAKSLEEKRYQEARQSFDKADKLQRNFYWSQYYRAHIDFAEEKFKLAEKGFERALFVQARLSGAHAGLAQCAFRQANYAAALVHFNRALELNGRRQDLYLQRGLTKMELGDWQGSQADLSLAIRLDKTSIAAYKARAKVREKLDLLGGSLQDYDRILSLDSKDVQARLLRAQLKLRKGRVSEALQDFQAGAKEHPKNALFQLGLGQARQKAGDNNGALSSFSEAIEIDKNLVDAYIHRGQLRIAFQDLNRAMSDFNEAIRLDRKRPDAYFQRIQLHLRSNNKVAATADARRFLKLEANSQRAMQIRQQLPALGQD